MYKEGDPEPASVKSDRTCILVHSLRIRKQKCARFSLLLPLVWGEKPQGAMPSKGNFQGVQAIRKHRPGEAW